MKNIMGLHTFVQRLEKIIAMYCGCFDAAGARQHQIQADTEKENEKRKRCF